MSRIQAFSIVGALVFLLLILEMVRRRVLRLRYALLWLLTGFALLGFGLWRRLVDVIGGLLGVYNAQTGTFDGEARWVKESRRFSYVVDPKTGEFIDRLQPIVTRINRETDLAGFPGPDPLDEGHGRVQVGQ